MMKTVVSVFLMFLSINLYAKEDLRAKGMRNPVDLEASEHLLLGKSRDGKIQLEDGTIFKILSSDAETVFEEWDYNEYLTFSANPYPTSIWIFPLGGSEFYLFNSELGEFVYANLHSSPNPNNVRTLRIHYIDPYEGEVILRSQEEEKSWKVEAKDLEYLKDWEESDRVIIGLNSHFFASFLSNCKFILVNCDKQGKARYVRVSPN
jgi:hypothetical protein